MFKKTIAIAAVMLVSLVSLFGCGGDKYGNVPVSGVQDTSYSVVGNGGSTVQYGNYVYFINGTRGYDDADGSANVFGNVVKGAVYRAELTGAKADKNEGDKFSSFAQTPDPDTRLGLKTHKEKDYKNDDTDVVSVERIAPKLAGTSGYGEGGLFLFGSCLYYASPNNEKDKNGNYQYTRTDFFRMTLDGKKTDKLYTTSSDGTSAPYGFMMYGGYVYLVVLDGTQLKSLKIDGNGKIAENNIIAENVTSAIIPVKPVWYAGVSENTIYDFIYFERAATADDISQSGEVLEFIRPNGESRAKFDEYTLSDYTLETVRDGYLFYRKTSNGSTWLTARNMVGPLGAADEKFDNENNSTADVERRLKLDDISSAEVYPYVPGYKFGAPSADGTSASSTYISTDSINVLVTTGSDSAKTVKLYINATDTASPVTIADGGAITVEAVSGSDIYYLSDTTLYGVSVAAGAAGEPVEIDENVTAGTYGADIAGGYLVYFGRLDADADGYTFFREMNGLDGANDPLFVGELLPDEKPSHTDILTVTSEPDKKEYAIGESLDLTGLVVEAKFVADKNGERPAPAEITVTSDMVSGFDSSSAGEKTVTVTYDKKTVDFTVTVVEGTAAAAKSGCGAIAPISPWFFIGGGGLMILAAGVLFVRRRTADRA